MKNMTRMLVQTAVLVVLLVTGVFPVYGDDTEIYVASNSNKVVRPNVLFIMDTSGSMRSTVSGTNKSRMQVMQEALNEILDSVSNVNVGLMRYSAATNYNNGGPILYPVTYIDAPASKPKVESQIDAATDDAAEDVGSGVVRLNDPVIDMVDTGGVLAWNGAVPAANGNYQENGTVSQVGGCCSFMGFGAEQLYMRIPNLNIPQGAVVTGAFFTFEANQTTGGATVDIYAVARDDMPLLDGSNHPLVGDAVSGSPVSWNIPSGSTGDLHTSPDISGLIQSVVNRPGWVAGNAIGLYFDPKGGNRSGCTHNFANCSQLPTLNITWAPAGGGGAATTQVVGLRFNNVNVPQGAVITKAYLEFVSAADMSSGAAVNIQAHKSSASPTFSTTTGDLSTRPKTTAVVPWALGSWTTGTAYQSPDVSSVVQEVVNLSSWCGGSLTFLIQGTGTRRFVSYDGQPIDAPRLVVEFDDASAVGGCVQGTVVKRVAGGNDDAEEASNGGMSLGGGELNFSDKSWVGLRFTDVQIPQGAQILSAELEMVARGSRPENLTAEVSGILEASPPEFAPSKRNISTRPLTSKVNWNRSGFSDQEVIKTPDISSVVSALVNQSGWVSGSSMAFAIKSFGNGSSGVYSTNSSPSRAPLLRISYKGQYQSGAITVRQLLKQSVTNFTAGGYTPISGTLFEAARYFRGEPVHYGRQRGLGPYAPHPLFRTSHPDSYTGGTDQLPPGCPGWASSAWACANEYVAGNPVYVSPIDDTCQTNHIVFLSDGQPNAHDANTAANVASIIGQSCASGDNGRDCGRKLVQFLSTQDQAGWLSDSQQVFTHTISFAENITFMKELADNGNGLYRAAYNKQDLINAFQAIVSKLQDGSRTFVSAGVSVNQFNRLTHRDELYFSLFQPDTDVTWPGNLKRYRISAGDILDANGNLAVNNSTGGFVSTAQSFWSSAPDGDKVAQGGAAEQLTTTRNVYTNVDSGNPNDLAASGNRLSETNSAITASMLGVATTADRDRVLQWARGLDTSAATSPLPARQEMGDPLHSRPLVVTYNDGSANGNTLVFVGNNQGYLHAIAATTGAENWSFVPKDLLGNLQLFESNATTTNHVYGLDGRITLFHDDSNSNSLVDPGETAILYVGMRRGGRNYYAIDISDPANPKLKFEIQGGVGDYAELGQTWSGLTVGKIKWAGADRWVLLFGGGYDPAQDTKGAHQNDSMGRTVYIADALTGQMLWNARIHAQDPVAGVSAKTNMLNSIPGDVRGIDLTGSGYIEHIYASDTGGRVFRFDVNQGNGGAADFAIGGMIAHLQSSTAEVDNRRFYYSPDVAAVKRPQFKDFIAVSLGSGFRAHPLDTAVNERFYVLRDVWVLENKAFPATLPNGYITENELVDTTAIAGDANGNGQSDTLDLIENLSSPKYGWYVDFLQPGEKVLSESITFNNSVIFTTYLPASASSTSACAPAEGGGRAYVLNLVDGEPKIDLNTDGTLDKTQPMDGTCAGDYCRDLGRGIPSSPLVIFEPTEASVCFGTVCYDDMLATTGERLQSTKWRRRTD